MAHLARSLGALRRRLGAQVQSSARRGVASSSSTQSPEAGAEANKFSLGDTGGVPKEEYADTFPDAYIMKVFQHQQASYRRYLDGLKGVQIPQNPESEEFSNYVVEMEKLKAKAGLPTALDMSGAQMVTMAVEANGSFRKFLELVTEGADTSDAQGNWDSIWQALDEVEKAHGPVPLTGSSKAAQAFSQKMKEVTSKVQKELGPSLMNEIIEAYRTQFRQFRSGQEVELAGEAGESGALDKGVDTGEAEGKSPEGNFAKP